MERILVINPGSTSTKLAIFDGENEVWKESLNHSLEDLQKYKSIYDQIDLRLDLVYKTMEKHGEDLSKLTAIASRGGPIAPVKSGAYEINDEMIHVAFDHPQDPHVSILGAIIADKIVKKVGIKAYIYDAVSVDEMYPLCTITGLPGIRRRGQGHNLNMRAAALKCCADDGFDYTKSTLIVSHLGGGISVSLHVNGEIADIIPDEDGCFAPDRAGNIPQTQLVELCYSGKYTQKEMISLLKRSGGLVAWLGTNDTRDVEKMIAGGDEKAKLIYEAMAFVVAENIGREAPVCFGKVDRIVLTGGIAYSEYFTRMIAERVSWIAPVTIIPGENEMQALANGVLRVLRGMEIAHVFHEKHQID